MAFIYRQTAFRNIVITASVVFQFALVLALGNRVSGGDAQTYLQLANDWTDLSRLLSHQAFNENFWPAGYSGFLALFQPFGNNQIFAVRIVQMCMVVALALMASSIASKVSAQAQRVVLVLVAFCPTLIWAVWAIGYELLLGLFVTFSLWQLWRLRVSKWTTALSGISFGLALVVQFRAVAVAPVMVVLMWRHRKAIRLMWVSAFAGVLVLWSLRSRIATGSWAPWSNNSAYNLWDGNGPHATGHNVFPLPQPPLNSFADAALNWMSQNPSQAVELMARKGLFLFYPTLISDVSDRIPHEGLLSILQWLYSLIVVALLVLFIGSLVWQPNSRLRRLWPLFAVVALFLVPNVLFIVEARFRIPVEALILAMCGAAACEVLELRKVRASNVECCEHSQPT